MPRRRTSNTIKLPNGNRVTVSRGRGRWGKSRSKTVTVRRPDGTGASRSYRRGFISSWYLGGYSRRVPLWARRGVKAEKAAERGQRKKHIAAMEHGLGMDDEQAASTAERTSAATLSGSAGTARSVADMVGSSDLGAAIRDARAKVIEILSKMDVAGKRRFLAMSAWPVEGPSPAQVAEAQEQARRSLAEAEELSALLDLRTRRLEDLLQRARVEGTLSADECFVQESEALRRSIGDWAQRTKALAQLYRVDAPKGPNASETPPV